MSLTLPVEELCRFTVSAKISPKDGRIALTLKPTLSKDTCTPDVPSGLSIHFETVEEDGGNILSVVASFEPPAVSTAPQPPCEPEITAEANSLGNDALSQESIDVATAANFAWLPGWSNSFMSELNAQAFSSDNTTASTAEAESPFHGLGSGDMDFARAGAFSILHDAHSKLSEVHAFNDTTYSSSSHFTPQPTSECLGQDDPFFCPSPSTSMSLSTPDSRTTLPNESSPAENNLPDLDESSATSSPSPDTPAQLSTVQQRWRRVACLHPGCDRQFVSAHTRRIHMRTHEPKARQYFPCTMGCSEAFSRQHDRMRHEVTKHGRECKWSCKLCRRFFSFEKTLKNHKCSGQGVSRWSIPTAESDETA